MELICKAPTRIDITGGTLDLWPIHNLLKGRPATLNMAVSLWAEAKLRVIEGDKFVLKSANYGDVVEGDFGQVSKAKELPLLVESLKAIWDPALPSIQIETHAACPPGAGLGGSSALAIALVHGLLNLRKKLGKPHPLVSDGPEQLVALCQNMESRIIAAPTGTQDYLAAVYGGLNVIFFETQGYRVQQASQEGLMELQKNLMLVFCGQSRASALNNWSVFRRFFDKDADIRVGLQEISRLSEKAATALLQQDWQAAIEISEQEWKVRKEMWPDIETVATKKVDTAAVRAGATFTRVCGAGGGGMMVIAAPSEKHTAVAEAISQVGGEVYPVELGVEGVKIF